MSGSERGRGYSHGRGKYAPRSGKDGGQDRGRAGLSGQSAGSSSASTARSTNDGKRKIKLLSNYYQLNTPDDVFIYDYRVDFDPPVESIRMRRELIAQKRELFGSAYVFDGGSNIKSLERIESEQTVVYGNPRTNDDRITITIRRTSVIPWGHPEMMRMYNTQMRRNLRSIGMVQIGRHYYDRRNSRPVDGWNMKIWPGIVTAINEHDSGILLMMDITHKIVRSHTVRDMLIQISQANPANFLQIARRELPGKIILANYNNKNYRIDDIMVDRNPVTYTFQHGRETITLKDYYRQQYDIVIQDESQPLLVVMPNERQRRAGQDQPIVLIPELCLMTGLTDEMRGNMQLKILMDNMTRVGPVERVRALSTFARRLQNNEHIQREMSAWNIQLDTSMVELEGNILPAEKIFMREENETNGTAYNQKTGSFEREIRSKNLRNPVALERWVIICPRQDNQIINEYCQGLRQVSSPLGVTISPPRIMYLEDIRTSTYIQACRSVPSGCQLVNVIVPDHNKDRYDAVKKIFCCEKPMASQVVTTRVLRKRGVLQTVCTKICIQMTVKLGAEAWALHIPVKNMMIAGYDCYHDTTRRGSSVGAFVCSLNPSATRWYSRVRYHQDRNEMSGNFAMNLIGGLKEYRELNGKLPDRLVVYRDGVGEGQISHVYDFEVAQIREALNSVAEQDGTRDQMKWAFIIVTKRINTKFFHKVGDRSVENPPPGTVVDTVVTRKDRTDFYLISQSVRQGTVNPTMYTVVTDDTQWDPIHHQLMANKLCHLYFNWAGTISTPAPCQYAHKLAYLTGTSLHQEPDPRLGNNLFYL
ncbi:piwi-like protein 1 [Brevipalpus obovatus]|uniref:piwi-like protein 1 n=1 Tax=Brevipalpus obovatus TaxID=246614 RepID=UPI003D9F6C53